MGSLVYVIPSRSRDQSELKTTVIKSDENLEQVRVNFWIVCWCTKQFENIQKLSTQSWRDFETNNNSTNETSDTQEVNVDHE